MKNRYGFFTGRLNTSRLKEIINENPSLLTIKLFSRWSHAKIRAENESPVPVKHPWSRGKSIRKASYWFSSRHNVSFASRRSASFSYRLSSNWQSFVTSFPNHQSSMLEYWTWLCALDPSDAANVSSPRAIDRLFCRPIVWERRTRSIRCGTKIVLL